MVNANLTIHLPGVSKTAGFATDGEDDNYHNYDVAQDRHRRPVLIIYGYTAYACKRLGGRAAVTAAALLLQNPCSV